MLSVALLYMYFMYLYKAGVKGKIWQVTVSLSEGKVKNKCFIGYDKSRQNIETTVVWLCHFSVPTGSANSNGKSP